jgi:hypothetical protein
MQYRCSRKAAGPNIKLTAVTCGTDLTSSNYLITWVNGKLTIQ